MQNPSPIVTVAHRTELGVSDVRYGLGALSTVPRKAATNALAPVRQSPQHETASDAVQAIGEVRASGPVTLLAAPSPLASISKSRHAAQKAFPATCRPTRTSLQQSLDAQQEKLRRSVRRATRACFCVACLVLTISTHGAAAKTRAPSQSSPVQPASPVQLQPGRRTSRSPFAVKRSNDARHAQRRRPVGPRPAGPSPQVHHPEPVRPGQTAAEPQEPALRRLPEAQDGLRDPLRASL
jgi:hypothetical protein